MTGNSPSRELDKFILRLPDGMRNAIGASAKANNRTMNSEIVLRLKKSLAEDDLAAERNAKAIRNFRLSDGVELMEPEDVAEFVEKILKRLDEKMAARIGALERSLNKMKFGYRKKR